MNFKIILSLIKKLFSKKISNSEEDNSLIDQVGMADQNSVMNDKPSDDKNELNDSKIPEPSTNNQDKDVSNKLIELKNKAAANKKLINAINKTNSNLINPDKATNKSPRNDKVITTIDDLSRYSSKNSSNELLVGIDKNIQLLTKVTNEGLGQLSESARESNAILHTTAKNQYQYTMYELDARKSEIAEVNSELNALRSKHNSSSANDRSGSDSVPNKDRVSTKFSSLKSKFSTKKGGLLGAIGMLAPLLAYLFSSKDKDATAQTGENIVNSSLGNTSDMGTALDAKVDNKQQAIDILDLQHATKVGDLKSVTDGMINSTYGADYRSEISTERVSRRDLSNLNKSIRESTLGTDLSGTMRAEGLDLSKLTIDQRRDIWARENQIYALENQLKLTHKAFGKRRSQYNKAKKFMYEGPVQRLITLWKNSVEGNYNDELFKKSYESIMDSWTNELIEFYGKELNRNIERDEYDLKLQKADKRTRFWHSLSGNGKLYDEIKKSTQNSIRYTDWVMESGNNYSEQRVELTPDQLEKATADYKSERMRLENLPTDYDYQLLNSPKLNTRDDDHMTSEQAKSNDIHRVHPERPIITPGADWFGVSDSISSNYNEPRDRNMAHAGIDVPSTGSKPIQSQLSGVISKIEKEKDGNSTIHIKSPNGLIQVYRHIDSKSVDGKLKVGDKIEEGQEFANIGKFIYKGQPNYHVHMELLGPDKSGNLRHYNPLKIMKPNVELSDPITTESPLGKGGDPIVPESQPITNISAPTYQGGNNVINNNTIINIRKDNPADAEMQ